MDGLTLFDVIVLNEVHRFDIPDEVLFEFAKREETPNYSMELSLGLGYCSIQSTTHTDNIYANNEANVTSIEENRTVPAKSAVFIDIVFNECASV